MSSETNSPLADYAPNVKSIADERHPGEAGEAGEGKKGRKVDGRSRTSAINGLKGGGPYKMKEPLAPEEAGKLVDIVAQTMIAKRGALGLRRNAQMGPVTDVDRRSITRLTGWSVEEFNAQLSERLAALSDALVTAMQEAVREGRYKPEGLSFALAVAEDKRARLDGRNGQNGITVNNQVNVYAGGERKGRGEILGELCGEKEEQVVEAEATGV